MRIIFIIILLILFLVTIISWYYPRKQKMSWFWTIFFVTIISILGFQEYKWQTMANMVDKVTIEVVTQSEHYPNHESYEEVTVTGAHCQRYSEAYLDPSVRRKGEALINGEEAFISYNTCQDLKSSIENNLENLTDKEILAWGVVIHEAYHLKGWASEPVTECLNKKSYAHVLANILNINDNEALKYAETYKELSDEFLHSRYKNGEC